MLKHLSVTFGNTLLIQLVNILGAILAARLLGPEGKGELTAVFVWPRALATIGSLGFAEAIIYFSGKDKSAIPGIFTNGLIMAALQSIVLMGVGYWAMPHLLENHGRIVVQMGLVYLAFFPLYLFSIYGQALLQGQMKLVAFNISRFMVYGSYVAGMLLLWGLGRLSVQSLTWMSVASNLIMMLVTGISIWRLGWIQWAPNAQLLKEMLTFGLKSHGSTVTSLMNGSMDQLLISIFLPAVLLGLYSVAVSVGSLLILVASSVSMVAFPAIVNVVDEHRRQAVMARFLRINVILSGLAGFALLGLTDWMIRFFFGEAFAGAIGPARILIIASFFLGYNMVSASGLKAANRPLIPTYAELLGLGITIIGLWFLLPKYQIWGASTVSLIAYGTTFLYFIWFNWRRLGVSMGESFLPQPSDLEWLIQVIRQWKHKLLPREL